MRATTDKQDRTAVLIRLPDKTHRALKKLADDHHRSMNAQVIYLIEQALEAESAGVAA